MANKTNPLHEMAAEVIESMNLPTDYDRHAVTAIRGELARLYVAIGSADKKAERLATANAYLAPFGMCVRDLDAMLAALPD